MTLTQNLSTSSRRALLAVAALLTLPLAAQAADAPAGLDLPGDVTGSLTFGSEYVFRGISQSDQNPAVMGAVEWSNAYDNGLSSYLGAWASNVSFNDNDEASTEFDFSGGLRYGVDKWTFDGGLIYYAYPGANDDLNYDYWEAQGTVGYDFGVASLTGGLNYSPEFFADSGDAWYYRADAKVPLPHSFAINAHVGRQEIDENVSFALPDYTDWSVGVSTMVEGFTLGVSYIDTNIDKVDCPEWCDSRAVFTVSRAF